MQFQFLADGRAISKSLFHQELNNFGRQSPEEEDFFARCASQKTYAHAENSHNCAKSPHVRRLFGSKM